jgi:hypothetical protein
MFPRTFYQSYGSGMFILVLGSRNRIKCQNGIGFRIPDPQQRIYVYLAQKIDTELSEI